MSDNHKPTSPSPDERRRMVDDALREFKKNQAAPAPEPLQELVNRAKVMHREIINLMTEVRKADESNGGVYDPIAMHALCLKTYLDKFSEWNKDELLHLTALWHTELLMEQLR